MKRIITIVFVATLLASCSVYRNYTRPSDISTEGLYGEGVEVRDSVTLADIGWREMFRDADLQGYIEQGLRENSDIRLATQRIVEAKASLGTARLGYAPTIGFNPQVSGSIATDNTRKSGYNIPLTMSWEIDIAGRAWNTKRGAEARYEQSLLVRRSVQTEIIAAIANTYYTLLMLDAQLEVSRTTAASWRENVRTMRALKQAGMANEASVSQTEANSCGIDASLHDLEYKISRVENTLALLLGTTPCHFKRGRLADQQISEQLLVGLPVQLLSNRPDVRSAEAELRRMFYNENLARAAFYPSLTLSGSAGWTTMGAVITSPSAALFSIVGNLFTTIFDRGRLRANLRIAEAQYKTAAINFHHTLLEAGSEVNDALSQCQTAYAKRDIRREQIASLQRAVYSTTQIFRNTNSTYLEVLTAQQSLLSAQLSQVSDRFDEIQGMINLYKALGGGGTDDDPAVVRDDEKTWKEIRAERRDARRREAQARKSRREAKK